MTAPGTMPRPPRHPALALAASAAAGLLALACARPPEVPERLRALVDASVVPGEGLGPLRLEQTTLGEVVGRFGAGPAALLLGERYGFELRYLAGQLKLEFWLDETASRDHDLDEMKGSLRAFEDFVLARPDVGRARLEGVTLRAGRSPAETALAARVHGAVGLNEPVLALVDLLGAPTAAAPEAPPRGEPVTIRYTWPGLTAEAHGDPEEGLRIRRLDLFAAPR